VRRRQAVDRADHKSAEPGNRIPWTFSCVRTRGTGRQKLPTFPPLAAARNVHVDKRTGSIAVGKEADLLLVDGDPSRHIGDLRHVDKVMLDGALLDGDALCAAAGFSGKPK
jgi:hypothetical protein